MVSLNAGRRRPLAGVVLGLLLFVVGCQDAGEAPLLAPAGDPAVSTGPEVGACTLVRNLEQDARSYFSRPEQQEASERLRTLRNTCAAGDREGSAAIAWGVLELMEHVLEGGRGGSPAVGASLARGLLACTVTLCAPVGLPELALAPALGPGGLFAVRGGGSVPVLARDWIAFTDLEGRPNRGRWGIEVDRPWHEVTGVSRTLFLGGPVSGSAPLALDERPVGNVQYDLKRFPTPGFFRFDALHVGVCLESPVALPHAGGDRNRPSLAPLMQREGVLLEFHAPRFCEAEAAGPSFHQASLGSGVVAMARSLASLFRAPELRDDRLVRGLGGSARDFSRFAPVAAVPEGTLEFLAGPPEVVAVGEPIGPIRVRARSGNGTPVERVLVTLTIENNQGLPAGADLVGDRSAYTVELPGAEGVATLPGPGGILSVGKAGGYILCAEASLEGFAFERVCTDRFHVRNR